MNHNGNNSGKKLAFFLPRRPDPNVIDFQWWNLSFLLFFIRPTDPPTLPGIHMSLGNLRALSMGLQRSAFFSRQTISAPSRCFMSLFVPNLGRLHAESFDFPTGNGLPGVGMLSFEPFHQAHSVHVLQRARCLSFVCTTFILQTSDLFVLGKRCFYHGWRKKSYRRGNLFSVTEKKQQLQTLSLLARIGLEVHQKLANVNVSSNTTYVK